MITKKIFISFIFIVQFLLSNSYSVEPDEILQSPEQELRARNISKNIRCMVCQNQNIAESQAPLAIDLRNKVKQMIAEGKDERYIKKYMADRYSSFILYEPPFNLQNIILWLGPFLFFISVTYFLFRGNSNK